MHKLNILNLATTDQGGAGIASLYFNEIFNKAGHNSVLLVKKSKLKNRNVIVLNNKTLFSLNRILSRLKYEWKKLKNKRYKDGLYDPKYAFFNEDESKQYISAIKILDIIPFKPDVIVVHWVSNFINSKTINELAEETNTKIFWLMMDNAPLTGGCHYPWDCKGFHSDCSNCPAILSASKKIGAYKNLALKKEYLPKNIEVIACSEIDYIRANKASIFKDKTIHKILFPIDETIYKPLNKSIAKRFFGIDSNKKVIFYGSLSLNDIRKGGQYFLESLSILQDLLKKEGKSLNELIILIAGNGDKRHFDRIEIPIIYTGYLNEERLIKAYQSAEVFVSTSIEDSGPTMVKQSIMCGTPVVSFEIGIALDLVRSGQTGYLTRPRDSKDLTKGIKTIIELEQNDYKIFSDNCRKIGLKLFSTEKQTTNFLKVMDS